MKFLMILSLCAIYGCMNASINVHTTKSYEGHYMTTNDFYNATKNISLDKDESIWVLSNSTLKQLLKNTGK